MIIASEMIPRPIHRALQKITHEPRFDVALSIAVKDLLRLRLKEVTQQREAYEAKYGMSFQVFRSKFQAEEIPDQYSHAVEKDYWEWEAAVTNEAALRELQDSIL
jgi:hypothetical protein